MLLKRRALSFLCVLLLGCARFAYAAEFNLADAVFVKQSLNPGEAGTISSEGSITATGEYAIEIIAGGAGSGDATLDLQRGSRITSDADTTLFVEVAASITLAGTINNSQADNENPIVLISADNVFLEHSGRIRGNGIGIQITGAETTILNTGSITGSVHGIHVSSTATNAIVVNYEGGSIDGADGYGILIDASATGTQIFNFGSITGTEGAVSFGRRTYNSFRERQLSDASPSSDVFSFDINNDNTTTTQSLTAGTFGRVRARGVLNTEAEVAISTSGAVGRLPADILIEAGGRVSSSNANVVLLETQTSFVNHGSIIATATSDGDYALKVAAAQSVIQNHGSILNDTAGSGGGVELSVGGISFVHHVLSRIDVQGVGVLVQGDGSTFYNRGSVISRASDGVRLSGNNIIFTHQAAATIQADQLGVLVTGNDNLIYNYGAITSENSHGIHVQASSARTTIYNYGSIAGNGATHYGIFIEDSSDVTETTIYNYGTITGTMGAIRFKDATYTDVTYLRFTDTQRDATVLSFDISDASITTTQSLNAGTFGRIQAAGVLNTGSDVAISTAGAGVLSEVSVSPTGAPRRNVLPIPDGIPAIDSSENLAPASISIEAGGQVSSSNANVVLLETQTTLTNHGSITGTATGDGDYVLRVAAAQSVIQNHGSILNATTGSGGGVELSADNISFLHHTGASIDAQGVGILVQGDGVSIYNYGSITSQNSHGIYVAGTSKRTNIYNFGAISSSSLSGYGIVVSDSEGVSGAVIHNFGTISGGLGAVYFKGVSYASDNITNRQISSRGARASSPLGIDAVRRSTTETYIIHPGEEGSVRADGSITTTGEAAVRFEAGGLREGNAELIIVPEASVSSDHTSTILSQIPDAFIENEGEIINTGTGHGVHLKSDEGTFYNHEDANVTSGGVGIVVEGDDNLIQNFGTITADSYGIHIIGSSKRTAIHNFGTITASGDYGILVDADAELTETTINNYGTITGTLGAISFKGVVYLNDDPRLLENGRFNDAGHEALSEDASATDNLTFTNGPGARIQISENPAFNFNDNNQLHNGAPNGDPLNPGIISSDESSAVEVGGQDNSIFNYGNILGGVHGIHITGSENFVLNYGNITGEVDGIQLEGNTDNLIDNYGLIEGRKGYGVRMGQGETLNNYKNGVIRGALGGIYATGADNTINNHGRIITTANTALIIEGTNTIVRNGANGRIEGAVNAITSTQALHFVNHGALSGNIVLFGNHDDVLRFLKGSNFHGSVELSGGDDVVELSEAIRFSRLDFGEGSDTLRFGKDVSLVLEVIRLEKVESPSGGHVRVGNRVASFNPTLFALADEKFTDLSNSVHDILWDRLKSQKKASWAQAFYSKRKQDAAGSIFASTHRLSGIAAGSEIAGEEHDFGFFMGAVEGRFEANNKTQLSEDSGLFGGLYIDGALRQHSWGLSYIMGFTQTQTKRDVLAEKPYTHEAKFNNLFISPEASLSLNYFDAIDAGLRLRYIGAFQGDYKEGNASSHLSFEQGWLHLFQARGQVAIFAFSKPAERPLRAQINLGAEGHYQVDPKAKTFTLLNKEVDGYKLEGDGFTSGGFLGLSVEWNPQKNLQLTVDIQQLHSKSNSKITSGKLSFKLQF